MFRITKIVRSPICGLQMFGIQMFVTPCRKAGRYFYVGGQFDVTGTALFSIQRVLSGLSGWQIDAKQRHLERGTHDWSRRTAFMWNYITASLNSRRLKSIGFSLFFAVYVPVRESDLWKMSFEMTGVFWYDYLETCCIHCVSPVWVQHVFYFI